MPNDWSLSAIAPALMKMTKALTHRVINPFFLTFYLKLSLFYFQKRMVHIEKSLSESVNLSAKLELIQTTSEPVMLNESR